MNKKLALKGYKQTEVGVIPEDWEIVKLKKITVINQGLQISIKNRFLAKVENSYLYITNEFLKENSEKKYYIKNPSKNVICNEDDILMTRTGNTGQVVTNVNGVFHNNFFKIKYENNVNKDYLVYVLKSSKIQYKILSLAGSSTIPDLNHKDFYSLICPLPPLHEQEKIAKILYSLDKTILNQGELIREKKLYKKGLMQKIFSQKIRFKNGNEEEYPEWEEMKLGEIFYSLKGRGLSKNDIVENGINYCILYGELYTTYKESIKEVKSRTNKNVDVKSKKGDILLPNSTTTTAIDLANATVLYKDDILIGGDITILRFKDYGESLFFAYYLTHYKNHELSKYGQGSTIIHMYFKDYKNLKVFIPSSIKEQQRIASFLSAIDNEINLLKKELEELQLQKGALMQKLLTGKVRVKV